MPVSLKGTLHFAGVIEPQLGAYGWVLYDNENNKLAEESGYCSYKSKDKVEYHALIQGR